MTAPLEAGFGDVAVLISSIDRVVTIDSGPAHLAGALGAPTSLLVDHFHLVLGQRNGVHAWYDSIELFRQPAVGERGTFSRAREGAS
ncbi:glycosyltransferase family 9 protein [Paraburkholderia sp. A1RI-2L]|uniref:glycosyltransferase family 9 protein n=1 Tax=Paraburkholderia sp. A1RI-2L TaxID=3028367 RepID=UPI003B7AB821